MPRPARPCVSISVLADRTSPSSFHVIGTIFDRAYNTGSLTSPPLVDHALSRMERGLVGALIVDGPPAPDIFRGADAGQRPVQHAGH